MRWGGAMNNTLSADTSSALERVFRRLEELGHSPQKSGAEFKARCPSHPDSTPSFSFRLKAGRVVLYCHAGCSQNAIRTALGLSWSDLNDKPPSKGRYKEPDRIWHIKDIHGTTKAQHWRYELPNGKKSCPWHRADGSRAEKGEIKTSELPLYGSEKVPSFDKKRRLFITEGEKACDVLLSLGVQALATITGAGGLPCDASLQVLVGFDQVVLWPDNDPAGFKHMRRIAARLKFFGVSFVILYPKDLPEGGDAHEWKDQERKQGKDFVQLKTSLEEMTALPLFQEEDLPKDSSSKSSSAGEELEFNLTDLGNRNRLVSLFGPRIRYAASMGWMIFDGKCWKPDATGEIFRLAESTIRSMLQEASKTEDKDRRTALTRHALATEKERSIKSMVNLSTHAPGVACRGDAFDHDPWLFNVQNGTIDLSTGKLRPHQASDMLTQISPVAYDPNATCPTWERFLSEVMLGDAELVSFLQRAVGYTLTGQTGEQKFFLLWGGGRNGKGSFMNVLLHLLGDYSKVSQFRTFESSRERANTPRGDLVALRGRRLVYASENDKAVPLAEALIKGVTGNDPLTARQLHREEVTFVPAFKLWLACNNKPIIKGVDEAIWERVLFIPWERYFAPEERDHNLGDKLKAEASGILNWALKGCLLWQQEGLKAPQKVQAAIAAYRQEMDSIARFFGECCQVAPKGAEVVSSELYAAYQRFCEEEGEDPRSTKTFAERLKRLGIQKEKRRNYAYWLGISLKTGTENVEPKTAPPNSAPEPTPPAPVTSSVASSQQKTSSSNGSPREKAPQLSVEELRQAEELARQLVAKGERPEEAERKAFAKVLARHNE